MAKQIYEQMHDFFSTPRAGKKVEFGLNHIDGLLNDIGKGKVIIIAGRSIDGRDEMLYTLMKNMAIDRKIPSLILNLATSEDTFVNHFISNVENISTEELVCEDVWRDLRTLENAELYIEFPTDRSMDHIEDVIREHVEKGVETVYIDLFQAIDYKGNMTFFDENELIYFCAKSTKRLYALAKDLGITVVMGAALSYMADEREGLEGPIPKFKDMAEQGRLDEFSDLIIGVFIPYAHQIYYDLENLRDVIYVSVVKNRINSKLGRFKMRYDFYHNRIVDEKEFNKLKLEELKRKNPVFNELAINLMLQQEDEI
jgi:replicative DNA helicase